MSHVIVNLENNSQHYSCETEDDGTTVFRVAPGTYTLTASLPGWKASNPQKTYVMTKDDFEIADLLLTPTNNHMVKANRTDSQSIPAYCV